MHYRRAPKHFYFRDRKEQREAARQTQYGRVEARWFQKVRKHVECVHYDEFWNKYHKFVEKDAPYYTESRWGQLLPPINIIYDLIFDQEDIKSN